MKTAAIRSRDGAIIGGVEIFQDVTERIERERLLLERKEKLETVLDRIGDGILFLDTAGKIAVVNRVCASLFGLDSAASGSLFSLSAEAPLRMAFAAVEAAYERSMRPGSTDRHAGDIGIKERTSREGGHKCIDAQPE